MTKFDISKQQYDQEQKAKSKVISTSLRDTILVAFEKYVEKTDMKPGAMVRMMIGHCLAEAGELDNSYLADNKKAEEEEEVEEE